MFEKEAEEWFEKLKQAKVPYTNENVNKQLHKAFKDGAEFAYNKANEWHYVKDILPEEDVYVYLLYKGGDYPVVARRHIFCGKTEWEWDCKWGSGYQLKADNEEIIAWKEIVLPELPKENV